MGMSYEGNHRFVSNKEQDRCNKCGLYVSKGNPTNGVYRYDCYRCGAVLEYDKARKAQA